jgi:biotin carboxylase
MFNGEKILVLGGTRISCEIIKTAQKMGLYVGVADYNAVKDSPGKQISDYQHLVSCTDVDAIVDLIKSENYQGVITGFSDMLLPFYAEICEKSGLPCYATKEQFELFSNKKRYKELCRKHNVPVIKEYFISDCNYDEKEIEFPVLIKPVDDSGSRGITICNNKRELDKAINSLLNNGREFIIEQYLDTPEVMVFWLFHDGKYELSAIANRHVKHCQGDDVVPSLLGFSYPSMILPEYHKNIEENAKKMFSDAAIKNGMMFMQCKLHNNTCYLFDIGYRLTGSHEYHIFEDICGYNSLEMMINFAMTGFMGTSEQYSKINPDFDRYGFSVVFPCKAGKIAKITGVEKIVALDSINSVVPLHIVGDEITESMRGLLSQVCFRVFGSVDKKELIYNEIKKVHSALHITSESGEEMLLPTLEEDDVIPFVL